MINNVMKIFIAGAIALTMVWFADSFINFIAMYERDIACSCIMRWLMGDFCDYHDLCDLYAINASYRATEILIRALFFYYWRLVISLFAYMVTHIVLFYIESKNRRVSAVLALMTILFFVAQFYVPIVYRFNGCYFSDYFADRGHCPLEILNEPNLFGYNVSSNETIYRIIERQVRTNAHMSVRIHLNHTERTGTLYFTFHGVEHENFAYTSRNTIIVKSFPLDSAQYREIRRAFSRNRFWHTPSIPMHEAQIRGGYFWVIEGVDSGRYHVVSRRMPKYGNPARLGNYIFDYAFNLLYEAGYGDKYIIFV